MTTDRFEITEDAWGEPLINGSRAIMWSDTALIGAIRQQARDIAELEVFAEIGRQWNSDSSLAKWFPLTAERVEQDAQEIAKLRADLAAAVAERDGLGYYRAEFEPIWDGLQDALCGERHIDSYGLGESEVECVRRVLRERDTLRARLAAIEKDRDNATLGKFYTDHVSAMTREGLHKKSDIASELAVRDARIADLERECSQWRDELRIYRETENSRIAELEQAVTVRDTEIARLETDLELARRDVDHLRLFARIRFGYAPGDYFGICHCCKAQFIGDKRAMNCEACADKAIDAARAGNGESCDAV